MNSRQTQITSIFIFKISKKNLYILLTQNLFFFKAETKKQRHPNSALAATASMSYMWCLLQLRFKHPLCKVYVQVPSNSPTDIKCLVA